MNDGFWFPFHHDDGGLALLFCFVFRFFTHSKKMKFVFMMCLCDSMGNSMKNSMPYQFIYSVSVCVSSVVHHHTLHVLLLLLMMMVAIVTISS